MPELTEQEYQDQYGHSRNFPVSLRTDETLDGLPFVICVNYIGNNLWRAVELDNEIMPYIRKALEEYKRNRPAKYANQRARDEQGRVNRKGKT